MNRSPSLCAWLAAMTVVLASSWAYAQQADAPAEPADKPAGEKQPAAPPPSTKSPYRQLAPGVMQSVDPMRAIDETVSRHDLVELLAIDRKFPHAMDVPFRRDIWVLDFKFKPVRMIWVDIPQPSGYMQRKLIWYMVYSVTNTGKIFHPVEDIDLSYDTFDKRQLYEVKTEERPLRFAPEFLLEGHQHMKDDLGFTKVYPDRVIPVAVGPIRLREDPNRRFLTSVEMCREIGVGETLWGVATWEDIDPRIVRFSIYVSGLTNAYEWEDLTARGRYQYRPGGPADPSSREMHYLRDEQVSGRFKDRQDNTIYHKYQYREGDPIGKGRKLYRKLLQLNFWRAGDQYSEKEEEIRYGVPGGLDYQWVYR